MNSASQILSLSDNSDWMGLSSTFQKRSSCVSMLIVEEMEHTDAIELSVELWRPRGPAMIHPSLVFCAISDLA